MGGDDARPLAGKRVLVTRAAEQAKDTVDLLRARGAEVVIFPAIEIHPPPDPARFASAVAAAPGALFVVFTSANGVERTLEEARRIGQVGAGAFGAAKIAAVGKQTARALAARGLRAEVVAEEFKQEGLAAAILAASGETRGRVVLFRALVGRDALPDALRSAGFDVEVVAAYETRKPDASRAAELARELESGGIHAVTFTSSSTVENTCDMLGGRAAELLGRAVVACIGPVTAKTCEARGVRVDVTPAEYTVSGLVGALEKHVSSIDKAAPGQRSSM